MAAYFSAVEFMGTFGAFLPFRRYAIACSLALMLGCASNEPVYREIPTEGFSQALQAWNARHPNRQVDRHSRKQILAVADNLLSMQRNSGGWAPNLNPFRKLSADERLQFARNQQASDASFANHNIFPQIFYLSHVYLQTGDVRYRNGARRALRLVLDSQLYNGGWSLQAPPANSENARVDTTATLDALIFLRQIAAGKMPYGYIAFDVRREAADAVRKGDQLLLRLQQAHDSRLSIWASAYDLQTSRPEPSAADAIPALDAPLGVRVVEYLMQIQRPPAEVVRAIEGAVSWYQRNTLQRWRARTTAEEDAFWPYSPVTLPPEPRWSRRYAIETSRPLLQSASPGLRHWWLAAAGDTGTWASSLIEKKYPAWRGENIRPPGRPSLK